MAISKVASRNESKMQEKMLKRTVRKKLPKFPEWDDAELEEIDPIDKLFNCDDEDQVVAQQE